MANTLLPYVVRALEGLNGEAHLDQIYEAVAAIKPLPHRFLHDQIRRELQHHSSDSDTYRAPTPNLFYSVLGKGKGVWGLRDATTPTDSGVPRPPRDRTSRTKAYQWEDEDSGYSAPKGVEIDPDRYDRGRRSHKRTQNALAEWLKTRGVTPESPDGWPLFDIGWGSGGKRFVAEVKSTTRTNLPHQVRLGLGQVLDYAELFHAPSVPTVPVLVLESEPPGDRWDRLCAKHGVVLVWPAAFDARLGPLL